jgi:chromosomal replication initiation ATPase DnaA
MKKLTYSPLQVIGEYVGNRNHSTVIHALGKVEQMIKQDTHLAEKITAIEHEILSRSV